MYIQPFVIHVTSVGAFAWLIVLDAKEPIQCLIMILMRVWGRHGTGRYQSSLWAVR